MKRAMFDGTPELKLVEVKRPVPCKGEVLIKVDSCTICGTDVHILDGNQPANVGVTLGHEFSGYVEALGEGVYACKVGDLVTVEPHIFCGVCKFCRVGKQHLCLNKIAFGVHRDGGFQQYVAIPQEAVYVVPEGMTSEQAALCEPISCCIHGLDRVKIYSGDEVVIFGGGVISLILIRLCKLAGATKIIVSEPVEARRKAALENGADYVINPKEEEVQTRIAELTAGLGPDVVIEASGNAGAARSAVDVAGRCGRIMFFGIVPPGVEIGISPNEIFKRELTIVGSVINPYTHYRAVQIAKTMDAASLITHRYPLSQINEAIDAARHSIGLKICIKPNE